MGTIEAKFTEFSYGYAVVNEILASSDSVILSAPYFPSLYDEGKTLGFDVMLNFEGIPVFYQFKLADHVTSGPYIGDFGGSYYKMKIRSKTKSKQHKLLVQLAKQGEDVRYIAPAFHTVDEFDYHYLNGRILGNSASFDVLEIGEIADNKAHCMTYTPWSDHGFFHSENNRRITRQFTHDGFPSLLQRGVQRQRPQIIDELYIRDLFFRLMNIVSPPEKTDPIKFEFPDQKADFKLMHAINSILHSHFGAQLIFLRPRKILDQSNGKRKLILDDSV